MKTPFVDYVLSLTARQRVAVRQAAIDKINSGAADNAPHRIMFYDDLHPEALDSIRGLVDVSYCFPAADCAYTLEELSKIDESSQTSAMTSKDIFRQIVNINIAGCKAILAEPSCELAHAMCADLNAQTSRLYRIKNSLDK